MRASFRPAPERGELSETELHVLVRDFPELLALFRDQGLDLAEEGHRALASASPSPEELLDRVEAALAWRGRHRHR